MRIGTAEPNSTFFHQGLALKQLLETQPDAGPVEVLTAQAASTENAKRLDDGDLDFGFMAANWIGRAKRGEAPFNSPIDLRMVAPANAGPLFFIVRADSPCRHVRELAGARVSTGAPSSGMTQHAHCIFGALGLSFSDFSPHYLHFAEGAQALIEGRIDAQLQCPIPNPVMHDADSRASLRVLSYAEGDLAKVLAAVPDYRRVAMRKGDLRALHEDSMQPGVVNVLVTHARQDPVRVALVAHTMAQNCERLALLQPLYRGMKNLFAPLKTEGAAALEFGGVALHDGAQSAYRALGLLMDP